MSAHTPAPWFVVPYGDGDSLVICKDDAGNARIAFMATPGCRDSVSRKRTWREIQANARLIAAAPALLKALEGLYGAIDSCVELTPRTLDKARAAIAAATGDGS